MVATAINVEDGVVLDQSGVKSPPPGGGNPGRRGLALRSEWRMSLPDPVFRPARHAL